VLRELPTIEDEFRLAFAFTPPTPGGNSYGYQKKRLTEKALRNLMKIKERFAQGLRGDALGRGKGAIRQDGTVTQLHGEYYHKYSFPVHYSM
jgi:hypothetical protein